jgi:hypothetical protein|nr:MAG TPA: hypothetical protein [Caudoviricetes sp.]
MITITPLTHFTIQGVINDKAIKSEARTLREHVAVLEAAAKLLSLPAFSEETTARIDANTTRAYTRAHRWFIDCPHPHGGTISSYHLVVDRITSIDARDWKGIRGVAVDEFLAGDFDTRRWFPEYGELLRVHPMPLTVETVAAYAELVMSAGGVFDIQDLELIVA